MNILNLKVSDYFIGVQVGLETHRRKNVGGSAFSSVIKDELDNLVNKLKGKGHEVKLNEQDVVHYIDKITAKTVDFSLRYKDKIIGIEVNFYTSSGSKPTEIKRSYAHVDRELEKVGVTLVWITDGIGYKVMKKSLKEAREIHPNIYNFKMMKSSLEEDVLSAFNLN